LLYGVVFAGLFKANLLTPEVMKAEPGFLWIGLAHIPFAILLTLVVLWRGDASARGGAIAGALLGLLMAASYDLSQYGTSNLWSLRLTLIDPFISMIMVGIAGAVTGAVLGRGRTISKGEAQ
jgi:uncharacterized membrane protein